ncbi:hypothetical protein [Streptomyces sp. NPDC050504]|uniref:terpene synthase family protein n=1 Tax=Streptomyces sp. NPDC050504 TaxID=3365618 RepID=UPI0037940775
MKHRDDRRAGQEDGDAPGAVDALPGPGHILYELPATAAVHPAALDELAVAWASGHGMLGDPAAAESLSRAGMGDLVRRAYPGLRHDRAAPLMGWFSWLFVIDDSFDRMGARALEEHASISGRMLDALPLTHRADAPVPDTPLARCLGAVWGDVAPRLSRWWRMRFTTHVMQFLTAFRFEALNRQQSRVPPLDEYVQLRRASGSVTACLDMLEFSTGLEVPPMIHATDQLRTMFDKATDVVVWVNDAVSLKKELAGGETSNGVLVVRNALGLSTRQAVRHVYDRVEADVVTFLAAERDLTRLCGQWPGITDRDRAAVASYCTGLKAWMRGNLDWSTRCDRYLGSRG